MEQRMFEIADSLKELRDKKKAMDAEQKALNEQIEAREQELVQLMTDEECQSFKRNGTLFTVVTKEYPAAVPDRKAELYDLMKQKGFEHLFTINSQTLSATVKELKSNNDDIMPEWLEGLIKVAEKTTIQLRKG